MKSNKHVFRQDVRALEYAALGDTSVRIITLHHLIAAEGLDALIVPPKNPNLLPLWEAAFPRGTILQSSTGIPESHRYARISAPTSLDWSFGSAGWTVFESVMWENGFFRTSAMRINPPLIFTAQHQAKAVMLYPSEHTDGNRVYDCAWWIRTCQIFQSKGFKLNHLGNTENSTLRGLYDSVQFDGIFEPTIAGLRECTARSSLAIGGSTGPTWTLLMSDIPQIVLESKRSPHGYWHFDRCQSVLTKRLKIVSTIESFLP